MASKLARQALYVDSVLDRAARAHVLCPETRFCVGDRFYCTLSLDQERWGGVSVIERNLASYTFGCSYAEAMIVDFPRSLWRLMKKEPSNLALEIVEALHVQEEVPSSIREHPLAELGGDANFMALLAMEDAAETHGLEALLFGDDFFLVEQEDDFLVIRQAITGEAINGRVTRDRYDWWRKHCSGDIDDVDPTGWNPLAKVVNQIFLQRERAKREAGSALLDARLEHFKKEEMLYWRHLSGDLTDHEYNEKTLQLKKEWPRGLESQ